MLKKMTSSLAVLSLFLGAVEDINGMRAVGMRIADGIHIDAAAKIPLKDADNSPVLVHDSNEEKLFIALLDKGINLLEQQDVVVGGISGLQKYLTALLGAGITEELVVGAKTTKIRAIIQNCVSFELTEQYHAHASNKAANMREATGEVNSCLSTLNRAIDDVTFAGNLDDMKNAFNTALNDLEPKLTGDEGLNQIITEHFAEGKSGEKLQQTKQNIIGLRTSLIRLVRLGVEHLQHLYATTTKMEIFHEMYTIFCSRGLGGDVFFNDYNGDDPATDENGLKTFEQRYRDWAGTNGKNVPNNEDSLI